MTDSPGNADKAGAPSSDGAVRNAGRRRLLRAGIASGPVVMTVLSKPVLANGVCLSPSGFTSGNVSNMGMGPGCVGRSPLYWQFQTTWPAPYVPTTTADAGKKDKKDKKGSPGSVATLFTDVFSPPLNNDATLTFLAVLGTSGGGKPYVARLCVAAVLNIAAGYVPATVMTKITVQHIWSEYATTNQFHSTAAAVWNEAEIIDYLLTTMPIP